MTDPRDYLSRGGAACLWLIAVLVLVSFIPPMEVCGFSLRRANILSELFPFEEAVEKDDMPSEAEIEAYEVDWAEVEAAVAVAEEQTVNPVREIPRRYGWYLADTLRGELSSERLIESLPRTERPAVTIEDFDTTAQTPLKRLFRKLVLQQPVRIAFLGDSFVEGDILTADLREALQSQFGGSGVGFAPFASPLTGFRRTIKTHSKGWTSHNIMQQAKSPAEVQQSFTVAGWACRPVDGATTRWEGTEVRKRLVSCDGARLWFLSRQPSSLELTVNDSLTHRFEVEADEALREIELYAPGMHSLSVKILTGAEGFVGHGAQFHGAEGVVLDNYSVRSNNGRALFWSSPSLNAQLQQLCPYDLVVLQYGLNMMQQGVLSYARYSDQLCEMVDYVRRCFPGAAVLILGVSERWVKNESGFAPMDAINAMKGWQRRAARERGAAFWATSDAMQALGGMDLFVRNGWAGKDYTHINYAGGRAIAQALYDALYWEAYAVWEEELQARIQRSEEQPVLDTLRVESLFQNTAPKLIP